MPPLLTVVLVIIALVVVGVIVAFLRRRRRAAQETAIRVAATPVPELSEDDIAWRIGVSEAHRPMEFITGAGFATAESEAMAAAAEELGAGEAVPVEAPVATTPAVSEGPSRRRAAPAEPLSRRYRLWRDSAAVLLVICLAILAVTTFLPGTGPGPDTQENPSSIALATTPTPSAAPTAASVESSDPTVGPTPSPSTALVATAHARPDAQGHAAQDPEADGAAHPQAHAQAHAEADAQADPGAKAQWDARGQLLERDGVLVQRDEPEQRELLLLGRRRRHVVPSVLELRLRDRPGLRPRSEPQHHPHAQGSRRHHVQVQDRRRTMLNRGFPR